MIGEKRVFASTLTYELGKRMGIERAARVFAQQLERPDRESLHVVRLFARLSKLAIVEVYHGASTSLPKARSRAAHAALKSGADFWLMCDDDVECDTGTLLRMFELAGGPEQLRAIVLPCLMRGAGSEQETVNVQFDPDSVLESDRGVLWRRLLRGGTGCMLVTKAALIELVEVYTPDGILTWIDDDGECKLPLFQTMIRDGKWYGEDFSFCERLRAAGVEIRAILSGASMHAGSPLSLEAVR